MKSDGIEAYEDALYQTFYCAGASAEKHLPSIPEAIVLYNTFFRALHEEYGGNVPETALIKRFTYLIYDLTGKPHYIHVKHHSDKSVFRSDGELWNISDTMARTGRPLLWQEYEICIAPTERWFDAEIVLAHELV